MPLIFVIRGFNANNNRNKRSEILCFSVVSKIVLANIKQKYEFI